MYQTIQIFRNTAVLSANLEINNFDCENCMKSTHDYMRRGGICKVTADGGCGMTQESLDIAGGVLAFILTGWVFKFWRVVYENCVYFCCKGKC
jgi:hypothetical protein